MPLKVRVAGLVMLALFHSFFGAAVGLVRDRTEGRWRRLKTLPLSRSSIVLDRTLAGSLVDLAQSGPLLILFWGLHGSDKGLGRAAWAASHLLGHGGPVQSPGNDPGAGWSGPTPRFIWAARSAWGWPPFSPG